MTNLYGGTYGIYLPHSYLLNGSDGSTISSTILDPIWEVSERASATSGGTFWKKDDQSEHVCKLMVHHNFFMFLPFLTSASDFGCLLHWGYFLCLIVSCLVLVGGCKQ